MATDRHAVNLRKLAQGRECQIRSDVCSFDPQTTVLAHLRMIGISAMSLKAPDVLGAHACAPCHELCDTGRHGKIRLEREDCELLFLRGVMRTQAWLIEKEILKW